ncbi:MULTISPECIES: hypothetical protein [unclassified Nonomuraea]|uniref:hypothetical protein n=1 Tax=unclassified Nonomuraea TaxID=2593643 RepID=UPI00340A3180
MVYFAMVLLVGVAARRRVSSSLDFLLSGRSLPPWITGLAFISANGARSPMCSRVVAASLIGSVLSLLPGPVGQPSSDATAATYRLATDHSNDGVRAMVAHLEGLDRAVLADVLEDVLDFVPVLIDTLREMRAGSETESGDAPAGEPGPETASTVSAELAIHHVAAGIDVLLSQENVSELLAQAEGIASGEWPLRCALCDKPIGVAVTAEVNLGLVISTTGGPQSPDLVIPAWTHPSCGRARVWAQAALNAAPRDAGLPIWGDDPAPQGLDAGREPDWFTSSRVRHHNVIYPLLVVQPGQPHPYGAPGHVADMLTMGLRPVELTRERIDEVAGWQVRVAAGQLLGAVYDRYLHGTAFHDELSPGHPA